MVLKHWTNAGWQGLCSETPNRDLDKAVNKEIIWFRSNGRMLDFRESDQDIQDVKFDKDLNKHMLWV